MVVSHEFWNNFFFFLSYLRTLVSASCSLPSSILVDPAPDYTDFLFPGNSRPFLNIVKRWNPSVINTVNIFYYTPISTIWSNTYFRLRIHFITSSLQIFLYTVLKLTICKTMSRTTVNVLICSRPLLFQKILESRIRIYRYSNFIFVIYRN